MDFSEIRKIAIGSSLDKRTRPKKVSRNIAAQKNRLAGWKDSQIFKNQIKYQNENKRENC
ncbi:hypothetical protein FACS189434_13330 [Bacteroidia bacterium]|nr:hypothetical protein FACS189434_13330 [Bacteroidia bacterium]